MGKKSGSLFKRSTSPKMSKLSMVLIFLIILLVVTYVFAKAFFFVALGISAIVFAFAAWDALKTQPPIQLPQDIKVSVSVPSQ